MAAEDLTAGTRGVVIGDRNFWAPRLREHLAHRGVRLPASVRRREQDPWPRLSRDLSRWRYRSDTIFGQLVERTAIKRIQAHDLWYLTSRVLRTVLMHTLAVCTNVQFDRPPLYLACLCA